jgi:tetratricopeptide (TPR) repeat protein
VERRIDVRPALARLVARDPAGALAALGPGTAVPGAAGQGELALRVRAAALRDLGRWREAAAVSRDAVRAAPDSAGAQASHALSLAALGRPGEARAAADRAVALAKDDPLALRVRGELLLRSEPREAERNLRAALLAAPSEAELRLLLARAVAQQGRVEEAVDQERIAHAAAPELARAAQARRRAVLFALSLGAGAFALVVAVFMAVRPVRGGVASPWTMAAVVLVATAVPLVAVAAAARVLRRFRRDDPVDPDARALAREHGLGP